MSKDGLSLEERAALRGFRKATQGAIEERVAEFAREQASVLAKKWLKAHQKELLVGIEKEVAAKVQAQARKELERIVQNLQVEVPW